jgi:hypothetical protein
MTYRAIGSGLALAWALAWPTWAGAQQAAAPGEAKAPAPAPAAEKGPSTLDLQKQKLDRTMQEQIGSDDEARASQARVEKLDDETQKLLTEYRRALADEESYTLYAKQLESQVASQNEEMASINKQLEEVETTSREVTPLMQRMLDTLGEFVALDIPFLLEERNHRVETLKQMMGRADVTISEKYRRILEAYQIEEDYGRTIEAYEAKLGEGADARTVQFLRVGRVALLYQTIDGRETGYWDAQKKGWVVDNDYRRSFKEGLAVAKKLRAPEMLLVPVPAPKVEEAKS